jgi:hypothetical protein
VMKHAVARGGDARGLLAPMLECPESPEKEGRCPLPL